MAQASGGGKDSLRDSDIQVRDICAAAIEVDTVAEFKDWIRRRGALRAAARRAGLRSRPADFVRRGDGLRAHRRLPGGTSGFAAQRRRWHRDADHASLVHDAGARAVRSR